MNITLYGQADYYYALSCQILENITEKSFLTDEQKKGIDDLNRKTIFEKYPSIADLEVSA